VPTHVHGVEDSILDPRSTWRDPEAYDRKARELADMFRANFERFPDADPAVKAAGPAA
jgi:phosphoenolpyruvate carboxykinase (ATP)